MSSINVRKDVIGHCRTQIQIEKFNFTWNIDNFWHVLEHITDLFTDKDTGYLRFRLHINRRENSLNFYVVNDGKLIRTSCSIFLKTPTDDKLLESSSYNINSKDFKLLCRISVSELKDKKDTYIFNNSLTIRFNIDIYNNVVNNSIYYSYKSGELINIQNKELVPGKSQLVKFLIDGEFLVINKTLLSLQSKYFEDMFTKNEIDEIELTDVTYVVFRYLLFFVGTGYLSKELDTDVTMLCELLMAADKYDIKNLKLTCEHRLINNISVMNAIFFLDTAYVYNGIILKNYAEEFIKLYFADIVNSEEFAILTKKFPHLLIEIQNMHISEKYAISENQITLING